jgi:hypothetical protein
MLTTKQMSGLVKVRYWRAPIIWQKHVGSENKVFGSMIALKVEIGVSTGLQDIIPARVRMSDVYLWCHSIRPIPVDWTSMPKK